MKMTCPGSSSSVFKCIERFTRQHVNFIDNVDFIPGGSRRRFDVFPKFTDFVDTAVGRRRFSPHPSSFPSVISRQFGQTLQGVDVGPCSQLSDLARMRATEVFPTPRGPAKKRVPDASLGNCVAERLNNRLLSSNLVKCLQAEFSR